MSERLLAFSAFGLWVTSTVPSSKKYPSERDAAAAMRATSSSRSCRCARCVLRPAPIALSVWSSSKKSLGGVVDPAARAAQRREALMFLVEETAVVDGVYATCAALAIATATYHLWRRPRHTLRPLAKAFAAHALDD